VSTGAIMTSLALNLQTALKSSSLLVLVMSNASAGKIHVDMSMGVDCSSFYNVYGSMGYIFYDQNNVKRKKKTKEKILNKK
jgi:hypothetical protein